jgi:hypothetical protein
MAHRSKKLTDRHRLGKSTMTLCGPARGEGEHELVLAQMFSTGGGVRALDDRLTVVE